MTSMPEFLGPNAGYVLHLYERYRANPDSVDSESREVFEEWDRIGVPVPGVKPSHSAKQIDGCDLEKIIRAARVVRLTRELGHLDARIDPLGSDPPGDPDLELETHGLSREVLQSMPAEVVSGPASEGARNAWEALQRLREVYCGAVGYETSHIVISAERQWLWEAIESRRYFHGIGAQEKREVLERLTAAESLERYLQQVFPGQKRFSLEGLDILIPVLDSLIAGSIRNGVREIVMGMAHRGRLNVLAHILGKPYEAILAEFRLAHEAEQNAVSGGGTSGWTGDVKYHLGARRNYQDAELRNVPITLAPNPSHLEFVNPVILGRARAAQEQRDRQGPPLQDEKASLAVLIHGDAAFPGQGIVAETLNLAQLKGYRTGGTIHIITNNQIGFTTSPGDARSTLYASDLAKGFEIPIVHVNADDPVACLAVARLAVAYHQRFRKDFLIDLIGYRRWGHNEGDEPAFTHPRIYEVISKHPTVKQIWANTLEREGTLTRDEITDISRRVMEQLESARTLSAGPEPVRLQTAPAPELPPDDVATALPADRLTALNTALLTWPPGFTVNAKLERIFQKRRTALETQNGIDWGHAEILAFGSILEDGTPIRLTGQDTERGTFSHRHLMLHDPVGGGHLVPLQALPTARASFAVHNSPLSENAALGFEYGYSMHAQGALVLWEAQFGDFGNSAQVIIDQFLVAGNAKWSQTPSLVLLLPHGYEGQGPEHSSARLERFLQLAANDNIQVVNCTTAAQFFHLLRRQAARLKTHPRPLVVMTPKSLLRHPRAGSSLVDLTTGGFQTVIDDTEADVGKVTRLVLCSGKVYVDLVGSELREKANRIAIGRIEQLYPFPYERLTQVIQRYPRLREIVWAQEEPRNMGAWWSIRTKIAESAGDGIPVRYVGRPESASPAEGMVGAHAVEQARIVSEALTDAPPPGSSRRK